MIIISPHLDDAVLSAGQVLAATPGSIIITVFAGVPNGELPVTDFDVRSGWTAANQAVLGRREEDMRACAVLRAAPVYLGHHDRQYAKPADDVDVVNDIVETVKARCDPDLSTEVLAPLGLMHPDHEQVHRCCLAAFRRLRSIDVTWYEELPARVLWPESVHTGDMIPWQLPAGDIIIKEAAMACYRSQAWALNRHACLVPERFWR